MPFTSGLSRKKRFKDTVYDLRLYTDAVIRKLDNNKCLLRFGSDGNYASALTSADTVGEKIHDHLLELVRHPIKNRYIVCHTVSQE